MEDRAYYERLIAELTAQRDRIIIAAQAQIDLLTAMIEDAKRKVAKNEL